MSRSGTATPWHACKSESEASPWVDGDDSALGVVGDEVERIERRNGGRARWNASSRRPQIESVSIKHHFYNAHSSPDTCPYARKCHSTLIVSR